MLTRLDWSVATSGNMLKVINRVKYALCLAMGLFLIAYQCLFVVPYAVGSSIISSNANGESTAYPQGQRMLVLANGILITVFTSNDPDTVNGQGSLIYWAYSLDNGLTWQSQSTGIYGKYPAVIRDKANNLCMVYEQGTSGNPEAGDIYFAKATYTVGPQYTWGNPVIISDGNGNSHHPALAVDSKGNLHVVFDCIRQNDRGNANAAIVWFYNEGLNWGASWGYAAQEIPNSLAYRSKTAPGTFPSIVVDANDNLFVTYYDGNGNFLIWRALAGGSAPVWDTSAWATFSNAGSPDTSTINPMMMHAAVIKPGGGEIAVVIPADHSATGFKYQLLISPTSTTPAWKVIPGIDGSSPGDGWPTLAGDSSGNYYAFITDSPSGYSNLACYKYLSLLQNVQPKITFAADPGGMNSYPSVVAQTFAGKVPVVWTSGSSAPYSVKYDYLSQMTLSINATYNADGSSGNGTVNFGTLSPGEPPVVVSSDPAKPAVQFTVTSDIDWNLSAQAASDLMNASGKSIPVTQLQWRNHGLNNPWSSFSTTPSTILANQGPTIATGLRYDYSLSINWTNPPGTYATDLLYTLSPN